MNIGIDATSIPKDKTGVGVYLINLIEEISKLDYNNKYYIFVQNDDIDEFRVDNDNFTIVSINSKIYRKTFFRLFWEQFELPLKLKQLNIDVLHSPHYTTPLFTKIKKIVTFHDMTFYITPEVHTFFKRTLFKLYMLVSSKFADKILTVSKSTSNDVQNILNVKPEKITVTYNAKSYIYRPIDDSSKIETVKNKYNISNKYILFVGTLEPRKNIKNLIMAFNKYKKNNKSKIKLVIVGKKGWMYEEIFEIVKTKKLENEVIFTGFVDLEDLPFLYNGAEAFIYPSIYEGFGIPVLEAMSCGTPVVTSNISSMPEIIGDAGLTINPKDSNELFQAIKTLLINKDLRKKYGKKGLERSRKFTWKNCAKITLATYEEVFKK